MKFAMTAAAAAALMLIATQGANAEDEVTSASCQIQFNRSAAKTTCNHVYSTVKGEDKCMIYCNCQNDDLVYQSTNVTVPHDRVYRLNNCNGKLKEGSC